MPIAIGAPRARAWLRRRQAGQRASWSRSRVQEWVWWAAFRAARPVEVLLAACPPAVFRQAAFLPVVFLLVVFLPVVFHPVVFLRAAILEVAVPDTGKAYWKKVVQRRAGL